MNVPLLHAAFSLLASLAASLAASLDGSGLRLDPEPGLRVQKEASWSFETYLEDWGCTWNGAEVPEEFLPEIEIDVAREGAFSVVDDYLACREGRLERLRRRYESAAGSGRHEVRIDGALESPAGERAVRSSLEGAQILFVGGEPRLEAGEVPERVLRGLRADLDLAALLPPPGTAPGESWTVEARACSPLGTPGGELGLGLESEHAPDAAQLEAHLAGEWTVREDGEDACGDPRLALRGVFESWAERATDLARVPIVDGAATERAELRLELTGALVWSRAARVLRAADLEGEVRTTVKTTRDLEGVAGEPTYEQVMRFAGRSTLSLETRVLD